VSIGDLSEARAAAAVHPMPGRAPCRSNPEAWYPPQGGNGGAEALAACRERCPIRWQCLRSTLDAEMHGAKTDVHGIAGGFTANQRRVMLRKRWARLGDERKPRPKRWAA
jgi:hypothetical protein